MYHQNDLNTIGCHLIVISLVFFKNSQFRTPRSLSPPWFPKIIDYLLIFWVTIILWLTWPKTLYSNSTDLPPPLKWPTSYLLNPPPDPNKYFTIFFIRSYWDKVKNSNYFHYVKWLLQITLTEEKYGFDTFKPHNT